MTMNPITVNWVNESATPLKFVGNPTPQHGTPPSASPTELAASGGQASVVAYQNNGLSPGAEGTYNWQISSQEGSFNVSYNHPNGSGTTYVQVVCPAGYVVSSPSQGPGTNVTFTDGLQQHGPVSSQLTIAKLPSN